MNTESYVKCPVCGLYEVAIDKSDDFESRICLKCGYTTNTGLKRESGYVPIFESQQPKLVLALRYEDDTLEQYWYPITIHVEHVGALYPSGTETKYDWCFAKSIPIPVMERLQYPIPGESERYYESRLQVESPEVFATFEDAYKKFKGIK